MIYQNIEKIKMWVYIASILAMLSEAVRKNMKGSGQYLSLLAIVGFAAVVCAAPAMAATAPNLGAAQSYGVLGAETVTNTGPTIVKGDLGVSPGSAVTGFPPGIVSLPGTIHSADAHAAAAQAANTAAFGFLDQVCTESYAGTQDLVGFNLGPGVYCAEAFALSGTLTLSGSGVWIFKSSSELKTTGNAKVLGGDPCSVWWRVVSSATLGTNTKLTGNILASTSIWIKTGASLNGRALAQTGEVTMDDNDITRSSCFVEQKELKLTKTASPGTYDQVSQTITYSYELKNTGNVVLSGPFTVSDDKVAVSCPATPASIGPDASIICTASHSVTLADLDAGSITNKATATAQNSGNSVNSNQEQATVTSVAGGETGALKLTKTASPGTYDKVGQTIIYSYELKNTGNVTLNGPFTVSDDKVAVSCPATPASIGPDASIICTASHSVTLADLDAGSITNKATATAENSGNSITSSQEQATVTGQGATEIPEFPLILLPVISVVGLLYLFQRRNGK